MSRYYTMVFNTAVMILLGTACNAAAFTPGNIYVTRVGTGVAALSTVATEVFLDEFTPAGNLVNTLALPTAATGSNQPLTMSGTATSEGALRRSADGRYLTLAGYAATPGTVAVASSNSGTINRVIGRIDSSGIIDTSTLFNAAFSNVSIRGAVTVDGSQFWATGGNSGVQYVPIGTITSTQLNTTPTNLRVPGIFNGQLYVSSATGTYQGVSSIGVGLPTSAGQTTTPLPGFPTAAGPSPYGFVMFDMNPNVAGIDTIYVADDRSPVANTINVQKWTFDGAIWALSAKSWSFNATAGVRGLSGYVNGSNQAILYAVTTETPSRLVTLTDDGTANAGVATVLATSGMNTAFRGVEVIPPPPTVVLTTATAGTGSGGITGVANPYTFGSTATITAQPAADSYFIGWSGCSTSSSATIPVLMDSNITCTAGFTLKQNQTISFGAAPNVLAGGTGSVSATATSGLLPVFSSSTTDVCTVSGTTVTGVKVGTCTIAADQSGDTTRNPAPQVTQSFPVILTSLPATENVGANMATLLLQSSATGTGYFTLLKGNGATCGSGAQVKAGQDSVGATAPYHGSLTLAANVTGRYTVRNLLQSTAYTVCFTADSPSGQNLQAVPATAHLTTAAPVVLTNPDWGVVGNIDHSIGIISVTSLTFAPDGTPYVAFVDYGNDFHATVMKYNGTSWVSIGSLERSVIGVSLAFAPDGVPYVAYGNAKATVKKYVSGNWELVGTSEFSSSWASFISLTIDQAGTPYVAFQDDGNSSRVTVMKFDGSNWNAVGMPGFSLGDIRFTSLSFAPDRSPWIAYMDWGNNGKAVVMKYDGNSWVNAGGNEPSSNQASNISLKFSPDGVPFIAYIDEVNYYKVTVKKLFNDAWASVGMEGFSSVGADYPSLAFSADGTPYVAFSDWGTDYSKKVSVMKFDTNNWVTVGRPLFSDGEVQNTSLNFSAVGLPVVAFNDAVSGTTVMTRNNGSVTGLVQDMNPTDLEQQVTFTATVLPPSATGTVTFKDGSTTLCPAVPLDVNNQAACAVSSLAAGTHTVTASYSGDAGFAGSVGSVDHLVQGKVLNLTVAGSGSDMVAITRNPPDGHPIVNCGVGLCQMVFPTNAALVLTPIQDVLSVAAAWDGPCAGSTVCDVTMDTDKSLTATFSLAPVANISTYVPYQTFAAAVSGARPGGDEIRMLSGTLGDVAVVTLDKSMTIRGGWLTFWSKDTKPSLLGTTLTVQAGDSALESVVVKTKLTVKGGSLRVKDVTVQ